MPDGGNPPALYAIDLSTIFTGLGIDPTQYIPSPNACAFHGTDLYVAVSAVTGVGANAPAAAILKFTDYLTGKNTTTSVEASILTDASSAYCGLACDGVGNLYAVENGATITVYALANPGLPGAAILTGTSQAHSSNFGDLAFDSAGNLWATDYNNNSIIVLPGTTLGGTNAYTIVTGSGVTFPVVNTAAGLTGSTTHLFTSPEGLGFDSLGNLWVGNNNDGAQPGGATTTHTTLVQFTPLLLDQIVSAATTTGGIFPLAASQALSLVQIRSAAPPAGFAIYQSPTSSYKSPQFGGIQIDRISATDLAAGKPEYLYVNDEVGQAVDQFDINPASPTFLAAIASGDAIALTLTGSDGQPAVTNPGNGGIALVYASLVIGDDTGDTGTEPDATLPTDSDGNPIFWESPNIGVGTSATPPADFSQDATIGYSATGAYIYVNARNIGSTDTTGTERLRLYWASGAVNQSWPEPWTEIPTLAGNIGVIAAGATAVITTPWPVMPNPADYGDNAHYCLLARIETVPVYPFGMTFWEKTQSSDPGDSALLSYNVVSNSKIAQRNIYIGTPPARGNPFPFHFGVVVGNYRFKTSRMRIAFQLLNAEGWIANIDESHIAIRASEPILRGALERMGDSVEHLGEDRVHLLRPERGVGHIMLEPGETIPLTIVFTPHRALQGCALRAMQYDDSDGASKLVGGQTFVLGAVVGFTTARR